MTDNQLPDWFSQVPFLDKTLCRSIYADRYALYLIQLVDDTVHVAPEWFFKIPLIAQMLSSTYIYPIYLPKIANKSEFDTIMAEHEENYLDLTQLWDLISNDDWVNCHAKLTHTIFCSNENRLVIRSGSTSRRIVELIRENNDVVLADHTEANQSIMLELLLQDPDHPLLIQYFEEYLRDLVQQHSWILFPESTPEITQNIQKLYLNFTIPVGSYIVPEEDHPIVPHPAEIPVNVWNYMQYPNDYDIDIGGVLPLIHRLQDINCSDPDIGHTTLASALRYDHFDMAQSLINHGADLNFVLEQHDGKTITPLMDLINGITNNEQVSWLIEHGADVNFWPFQYGPLTTWYEAMSDCGPEEFIDPTVLVRSKESGVEYVQCLKELFPELKDIAVPENVTPIVRGDLTELYYFWRRLDLPAELLLQHDQNAKILKLLVANGLEINRKVDGQTFLQSVQGKILLEYQYLLIALGAE